VPAVPDTAKAAAEASPPRPGAERLATALRGDRLERVISAQIAAVTGRRDTGDLDGTATFGQLGLTSVGLLELHRRLQSATGVPLPTTFAFDHPTPDALRTHIASLIEDGEAQDVTVEETVAREEEESGEAPDAIAVVGMACRYPGGVRTPDDLWEMVTAGTDAVSAFPDDRGWTTEGLFPPGDTGLSGAAQGGFLVGMADFDPSFFGISDTEALAMDPQQRLLLETAWEALERAGIDPLSMRGSACGVFMGIAMQDYRPGTSDGPDELAGYRLTGAAPSLAAGRVAYFLGTHGPAMTLDTACSSSLVALHLACQSLSSGESSLALVGGATVLASPDVFREFSRQGGLAGDGRCKAFSTSADGTGWAEGAGVLLVERVADARRLGHPVLAVVRATAINQDGATNGLTAPSGLAQREVIQQTLAQARLSAADVDLVEAHGTGTMLGDPVEAGALLATYGAGRPTDDPVWLGSLKSNIGHTLAAAGVGGVIKVVMAMRHGILPKTLHAENPTPQVAWDSGAMKLLDEARPWPDRGRPRRAAVSSFGMSGTNAHTIIEHVPAQVPPPAAQAAAPEPRGESTAPEPLVWPVSGHTRTALRAQARQLYGYADLHPDVDAADIGRALAARSSFRFRAAAVGLTRADVLDAMRAIADGRSTDGVVEGVAGRRKAVFVRPEPILPDPVEVWRGYGVTPSAVLGRADGDTRAAVAEALAAGHNLVIHCGTDPAALDVIRQAVRDNGERGEVIQCSWPVNPGDVAFVRALAQAYVVGAPVDWPAVLGGSAGRRADLPTYAFQSKRYWALPSQPPDAPEPPATSAAPPLAAPAPAAPAPAVSASDVSAVSPRADRREYYHALLDLVTGHLAGLLNVDAESVDPEVGFFQQGLDSMAAVQLRQALDSELGLTLHTTLLFELPTAAALAQHLADELSQGVAGAPAPEAPEHEEPVEAPVDPVPSAQTPDDELIALLAAEIDRAGAVRKGMVIDI